MAYVERYVIMKRLNTYERQKYSIVICYSDILDSVMSGLTIPDSLRKSNHLNLYIYHGLSHYDLVNRYEIYVQQINTNMLCLL